MANRTNAQRLDGVEESIRVLRRDFEAMRVEFGRRVDVFLKIHEESKAKEATRVSVSPNWNAAMDGPSSSRPANNEQKANLVDDEDAEVSLSDGDAIVSEVLGDEEIKPNLIREATVVNKLDSVVFAEDIRFKARFIGRNLEKHGSTIDLDEYGVPINKILTERRAPTSPLSKKRKKTTGHTSSVKDRGRREGHQRSSNSTSPTSTSASETKKMKVATFVKDRGKSCFAGRVHGRRAAKRRRGRIMAVGFAVSRGTIEAHRGAAERRKMEMVVGLATQNPMKNVVKERLIRNRGPLKATTTVEWDKVEVRWS